MIEQSLGVGVIYTPGLDPWIQAGVDMIDVLEVEPQTHWYRSRDTETGESVFDLDQKVYDRLSSINLPKVFHSVGLPVAGHELKLQEQITPLQAAIDRLKPLWFSEHLNFNYVGQPYNYFTNFLLPPLQTEHAIPSIVKNINRLKQATGLPFLFEIGANYLSPRDDEIPDGEFYALIAEQADCGILLDLHNVWTNARNGRESIEKLMASLPLERVQEIHLAAGRSHKGYWIDAHSGLVQTELWEIAHDVVPALGNLNAITFEMVPEYIEVDDIKQRDFFEQLENMQDLWSKRALTSSSQSQSQVVTGWNGRNGRKGSSSDHCSLVQWQHSLGSHVLKRPTDPDDEDGLADDKGVEIYQDLIRSVRGGLLISALPFTTRYIRLSYGEEQFAALIEDFWQEYTPHPFASEEALNFVKYIEANFIQDDEHSSPMSLLINYETSLIRNATMDGQFEQELDEKTAQLITNLIN